jgi:Flp pilus assembly protein CpaB
MGGQIRTLLSEVRLQWLGLIARRRRWLVAGLVGSAVAAGVAAVAPRPVATRSIWVAARDLSGGRALRPADLRPVAEPIRLVPARAEPAGRPLAGRVLAAPVRAGEPITDVRLLGADLLRAVAPGHLATAIHVADGGALTGLVHVGDRVDAFADTGPSADIGAGSGAVHLVAGSLPVLALPGRDPTGGGLVVVAATRAQVAALAAAATTTAISVAVQPTAG